MRTFERGDVIKVPFPYTDRATRQSRPAVVVSTAQLQELHGLLWVVMITSAENRGWPDDVPVANLKLAGLPVPSLIRSAKIATIDASDASKLGRVAAAQLRRVTSKIKQRWGLCKRCPLENKAAYRIKGLTMGRRSGAQRAKSQYYTLT